ncbi:hypothetical protein ANTQUA_LOCUS8962, partial [Anthophora quadrimaculata]
MNSDEVLLLVCSRYAGSGETEVEKSFTSTGGCSFLKRGVRPASLFNLSLSFPLSLSPPSPPPTPPSLSRFLFESCSFHRAKLEKTSREKNIQSGIEFRKSPSKLRIVNIYMEFSIFQGQKYKFDRYIILLIIHTLTIFYTTCVARHYRQGLKLFWFPQM